MTESRDVEENSKKSNSTTTEEASRVKNLFMAKVSHELRSPLNSIIGFAELMYHEKVGSISPEHKEYLGDILTSSRHLLLLINDMLDLAKAQSGKMSFHSEKIDIAKVLNETSAVFQSLIADKNMTFKVEVDPVLQNIVIDPTRFKQIIYNFVSNALKCTSERGVVILRAISEGRDYFKLEVEDNGIGIKKEDLNLLFVEFQQLDRNIAKQYPSSGLGLALTKHIVECQGGRVGVNSVFGQGSKFFAILPTIARANSEG